MRDPFDAQPNLVNPGRQSPSEFPPPSTTVPPGRTYMIGNGDAGAWNPSSDSIVRHQSQNDEVGNFLMDPELTELLTRFRSQEEQTVMLRKQVTDACNKELQLLKEKHVLERRLSDLRMALDEKQDDAISEALKVLTHKKSYIEENIRLAHDLQIAEEDVYVFTSTLVSLLAEYNIRLPLLNASTIANSTKRLYLNMDWKIRSSDASLDQRKHLLGNLPGDTTPSTDRQPLKLSKDQLSQPHLDSRTNTFHQYNHYPVDPHLEPTSNQSRSIQDYGMVDVKSVNPASNPDMRYREFPANNYKEVGIPNAPNYHEDNTSEAINRREITDDQFYMRTPHERQASLGSEGEISLPGIEGFQIIGEAKPGNTLRACGYPTNGTSLCIFQWVRHLENGTRQSIEGATVPEYVVTADDVDTFLAVDCIPMDDNGRQGELVSLFANGQNKITCDPDTQHEIDTHIMAGSAIFAVLLLMDSSEAWEQTNLILKRTGYQIKVHSTEIVVMEEKYSPELYVKVPNGHSNQFVLICSDGTTLPFSTSGISHNAEEDIRSRHNCGVSSEAWCLFRRVVSLPKHGVFSEAWCLFRSMVSFHGVSSEAWCLFKSMVSLHGVSSPPINTHYFLHLETHSTEEKNRD